MDFKPRTSYLLTLLNTFTLLFLVMTFAGSAFCAAEEESLYVIHVSSFKNQKSAEVETSKFLEQGLQAFYHLEAVEGKGNWYRVFIGTFRNRQEATAKGVDLMKKGIIIYAAPRKVAPDFIPGRKAVEAEAETVKPVTPPVIVEKAPQAEVPQKEVAKPIAKEEAPPVVETSQKPAAKPVEKEEKAASVEVSKKQAVESAEKKVQESPAPEKKTEMDMDKKAAYQPKSEPSSESSKFSLALNAGAYISGNAEDFQVTEQTPTTDYIYYFSGNAYQISLESTVRAYKDLNFYGRVEYAFVDEVDILFVSLGPKLRFTFSDAIFPYMKAGMVWGDLNFDTVPGEFDSGVGYEGGFGLDFLKGPFKIGADLLYRSIEFDYISPGVADVTTNANSLDASGFSLSGTLSYYF